MLVAMVLGLACTTDDSIQPPDGEELRPALSVQACAPPAVSGTTRPWVCAQGVYLLYLESDQSVKNAIDDAASRWNAAFDAEGAAAVPRFTRDSLARTDSSSQRRTVRVVTVGQGPTWCDATNVAGTNKEIRLTAGSAGSSACVGNAGSLNAVLLHALGHALGLSSSMHRNGVAGVSNHCSIHLPAAGEPNAGSINNQLCQHEIEVVAMIYGAYPIDYPGDFWSRHILNRTGLPASVTLREDETRLLNPVAPFFQYAQNPPPVNGLSLAWRSDDQTIAIVEPGNVLTPRKDGFTRVRATVQESGLPSTVRRSVRLRSTTGQPVSVTATKAVWQPGYRVTAILGAPTPLNGGEFYNFTTTVVNGGPSASLRVTWRLIRSYAPADTQVVANTPNQLNAFIGEGSYGLRIIATPRDLVSDSTGGSFVRDWSVCTGQVLSGGGVSTNQPAGCGQPPLD
jgi:hypothetical protein